MRRALAGWLIALVLGALPVTAAPVIPGADTPEFNAALEQWLAGDDLPALRAFATLAQADNRAAQIFLSQIAEEGHLHTHVTADLPRKERVALLRQPGGLSGKSWLEAAKADVPLAAALVQAKRTEDKAAGIRALLQMGETTLALRALNGMITGMGFAPALSILRDNAATLPPEAAYLRQIAENGVKFDVKQSQGSARLPSSYIAEALLLQPVKPETRLTWLPVTPRDLMSDPKSRAFAQQHAQNVPALAPLRAFCEQACPDNVPDCTAIGSSELFLAPPFPFSSPLESLLPNERYWSSPRITHDMAQRYRDGLSEVYAYVRGLDTCFIPAITIAKRGG